MSVKFGVMHPVTGHTVERERICYGISSLTGYAAEERKQGYIWPYTCLPNNGDPLREELLKLPCFASAVLEQRVVGSDVLYIMDPYKSGRRTKNTMHWLRQSQESPKAWLQASSLLGEYPVPLILMLSHQYMPDFYEYWGGHSSLDSMVTLPQVKYFVDKGYMRPIRNASTSFDGNGGHWPAYSDTINKSLFAGRPRVGMRLGTYLRLMEVERQTKLTKTKQMPWIAENLTNKLNEMKGESDV